VQAAVVASNDDLKFAVHEVGKQVSDGVINPEMRRPAIAPRAGEYAALPAKQPRIRN
jgi:hypothetical protein